MSQPLLISNVVCVILVHCGVGLADNRNNVDFDRDVWPILEQHCVDCHGEENREGGLRLTTRNDALALNDSGKPAIVPQNTAGSELIARLTTDDDDQAMPLDADRLSDEQIGTLRRWITEGALWPDAADESPRHWSYVAPQRPARPQVFHPTWAKTELDFFVLAKLENQELKPSPPASRARLLRRVYLDLIGIPPSIEQVDAFLADGSDDAFERVVDQLLASSHFGEKWARGWLDLARYSDSNGYQADQIRHMWAYRDWVIDAFNNDMPFDQFTIEQIAGDLLPNASVSQRIATGFHRATTCNVEAGVDPEGNRTDQVIDRVNTTATVWLGTTLECAQCHNHKYDPFSQQDYYQIFAFFNNTPIEVEKDNDNANNVQFNFWGPKLELPVNAKRFDALESATVELNEARQRLKQEESVAVENLSGWECALTDKERAALPKAVGEALNTPPADRTKQQLNIIKKHVRTNAPEVKRTRAKVAELEKCIAELSPDTTLVMVEMAKPRDTNIFIRGEFLNEGPQVQANVPSALHAFPEQLPRNRLGFSKWLVDEDNPLIARVAVNRWWSEIFGTGLVKTSEDFGKQGDPPTHPALLDWLAVEFMENGWSRKHILKRIVMSTTYQQDSIVSADHLRIDPANQWLSRGPRFRLPAESIRDNALAVSGLLSKHRGGEPVFPPQPVGIWHQTGRNEPIYNPDSSERRYRRGIYVVWRRAAPYPSFVNFDAPDRMSCTVERPRTNTPLQALTLLNDEAFVESAKSLAAAIDSYQANTIDEKIAFGFRRCVARNPHAAETSVIREIYTNEVNRLKDQTGASSKIIGEFQLPSGIERPTDLDSWAAWFCVSNVLLNLDETITKN